jgi:hypothetical protein
VVPQAALFATGYDAAMSDILEPQPVISLQYRGGVDTDAGWAAVVRILAVVSILGASGSLAFGFTWFFQIPGLRMLFARRSVSVGWLVFLRPRSSAHWWSTRG